MATYGHIYMAIDGHVPYTRAYGRNATSRGRVLVLVRGPLVRGRVLVLVFDRGRVLVLVLPETYF